MDLLDYKKKIWQQCNINGQILLQKGLQFYSSREWEKYLSMVCREEFSSNSRYLHRGFYCPSPVRDIIVVNSKRGRLLKRVSKRSNITHRYYFDSCDRLIMVDATLPNKTIKREYLAYKNNSVYGFAFDGWDTLVGITEEKYEDGRLKSYLCCSCYCHPEENINFGITEMLYEEFDYISDSYVDDQFYIITPLAEPISLELIDKVVVNGTRYRFIQREDELVAFYTVRIDGKTFENGAETVELLQPVKLTANGFGGGRSVTP